MINVNQPYTYRSIEDSDGSYITDPQSKAGAFATHVAAVSNDSNYSNAFLQYIKAFESVQTDLSTDSSFSPEVYNELFTIAELKSALAMTAECSSGLDRTNYKLLKYIPDSCLRVLVTLYNTAWCKQSLPSSNKHSVVVLIRKPGLNTGMIDFLICVQRTSEMKFSICLSINSIGSYFYSTNLIYKRWNEWYRCMMFYSRVHSAKFLLVVMLHGFTYRSTCLTVEITSCWVAEAMWVVPHCRIRDPVESPGENQSEKIAKICQINTRICSSNSKIVYLCVTHLVYILHTYISYHIN